MLVLPWVTLVGAGTESMRRPWNRPSSALLLRRWRGQASLQAKANRSKLFPPGPTPPCLKLSDTEQKRALAVS